MDDDPVLLDVSGGVATISLNQPDRHNVLDDIVDGLFFRYLDLLRTDRAVRVVVWRANGPTFSSGRPVGDDSDDGGDDDGNGNGHHPTGRSEIDLLDRRHWSTRLLYDFPVPIICALKGWVLGAAFEQALLCDLRVAGDGAKMALSGIDHGLVGDAGGVAKVHEIGGSALALDLALTGRRLTAAEAHRLGLVSRVVPDDELDAVVGDMAAAIAARPPLAVRLIRDHVQALATPAVDSTLRRQLAAQTLVASSEDHAEMHAARAEDREPQFERR